VEGFSVREAAEILGAPQGTVKSRCARGRARLAELLSDLGPGNPSPASAVQRPVAVEPTAPRHDDKHDEDKEGSQ